MNYFPHKNNLTCGDENEEHNQEVFSALQDVVDDSSYLDKHNENRSTEKNTQQIINMTALQITINKLCMT